jgi:hypothetical protein
MLVESVISIKPIAASRVTDVLPPGTSVVAVWRTASGCAFAPGYLTTAASLSADQAPAAALSSTVTLTRDTEGGALFDLDGHLIAMIVPDVRGSLLLPAAAESGETLILLAGSILLAVGVSRVLDLSPLVASLTIGATLVNLTPRSRRLFGTMSSTDPPFYAIFFVIAGAELDVTLIPSMGALGLIYLLGRAFGKLAGVRVAAGWLGMDAPVQRYLGFALLAQAGLAIGLTLAINQRFPDLAPVVSTVILAAVAVSEIIGPISARYALVASGEAGLARPGTRTACCSAPRRKSAPDIRGRSSWNQLATR